MIDESFPYVAARLGLVRHMAVHGAHGLPIDEANRAKDSTTKLVGAWLKARDEEAKLRQLTLTCVTFTSGGKIEVHAPDELEDLNGRIHELCTRRIAAEDAIRTLQEKEPSFLCDLKEQQRKLQKTLDEGPTAIDRQLAAEITHFNAPSIEIAQKSHRYLRAKSEFEGRMADAKSKLAELEPRIELIRSQCEVI